MNDKELLEQAKRDAIILRIFGDMPTYQRSLPACRWVPTGKLNDRGEMMYCGEPR